MSARENRPLEGANRLRARAAQLREIASELDAEAARLEMRGRFIGGREIADAAVPIMRAAGKPLTYHEMWPLIEASTGRRVRGAQPKKTLVANLSRDARIVPLGGGRFALACEPTTPETTGAKPPSEESP